jgi:hypothetical protein
MASFVLKMLLMTVPFGAMVAFSVTIDPVNLFHRGPEPTIASMLLAGRPVAGLVDYEERVVQQHYISGLAKPKDVIVLGSSRAMQIRAAVFPGRSFFNHSLSGGLLGDYAAVVRQYHARRFMPHHVVLGLDPWLLSAHANRPVESGLPLTARLREAASPSYFQAALRSFKAYGGRPWPRAPLPDEPGGTTLADGSRVYPKTIRDRKTEQVRAAAVRTAGASDERLLNFDELDERLVSRLEMLVRDLRAGGATVEFLLAPYHPVTLEKYRTAYEYRMVFPAERRFRQLAVSLNVPIRGDYDAAACGCDDSELLDGGHPRDTCVAKILSGTAH